uniref:Uncharacterized protein n=1 Tax=Brassica oleracea var. oleracea TaxID=109376 RepID=A0A0D3DL72_BRAOL
MNSEEISRRSSPSVYSEEISDKLVILGISSEIWFLGIPSEISEGFPRKEEIPRNYFRGLVSSNGSTGQAKKLTIEDLFMRTHALTQRLWRRRRTENIEEDLR